MKRVIFFAAAAIACSACASQGNQEINDLTLDKLNGCVKQSIVMVNPDPYGYATYVMTTDYSEDGYRTHYESVGCGETLVIEYDGKGNEVSIFSTEGFDDEYQEIKTECRVEVNSAKNVKDIYYSNNGGQEYLAKRYTFGKNGMTLTVFESDGSERYTTDNCGLFPNIEITETDEHGNWTKGSGYGYDYEQKIVYYE